MASVSASFGLDKSRGDFSQIAASEGASPCINASARMARAEEPTSVTLQSAHSCARGRGCNPARPWPGVARTEISFERDWIAAGLIAGTVPMKGNCGKRARKCGSTRVEAVLQAMTATSGT